MINDDHDDDHDHDDDEKYYYFVVKSKLELYSFEWLRSKKEPNEDNCFQNALDDALNYQTIIAKPRKNIKIKGIY